MLRWSCLLALLGGCATYSQVLVNPLGQTAMCQAHGSGLIGSNEAKRIQQRCQESLRAAGYIEIERAGVLGIVVSDSLDVVRVIPGSPADSVGIEPGDRLIALDGQTVHERLTVQALLFGPPGTAIAVRLLRAGEVRELVPVRKPYPAVYGMPPAR